MPRIARSGYVQRSRSPSGECERSELLKAFCDLCHGHLDEIAIRPHVQFHIVQRPSASQRVRYSQSLCFHRIAPRSLFRYAGWTATCSRSIRIRAPASCEPLRIRAFARSRAWRNRSGVNGFHDSLWHSIRRPRPRTGRSGHEYHSSRQLCPGASQSHKAIHFRHLDIQKNQIETACEHQSGRPFPSRASWIRLICASCSRSILISKGQTLIVGDQSTQAAV